MDESTTTDAPAEDAGASQAIDGVPIDSNGSAIPDAQPVAAEDEAAEATETPAEDQKVKSEPSEDEQLASWAENKGLKLDSDNAKKAAKMARDAERAMHQKAQQKSELEKSLRDDPTM